LFVVLWMFEAKAGAEEDFVRAFGPEGDWAQLFRRSGGGAYLDTQLVRDIEIARRFVTIDRWASRAAFDAFKAAARADYDALDARCRQLTRSERLIGHFET
jgi:heme-degrading monooxygenase HmoA